MSGIPESEQETREWELGKIQPRRAAPADISGIDMETVGEPKPRRDWGTDLLLVGLCLLVSLVGGFVGTVLGNAW
jgi:hypothetical protein